MKLIVVGAAGRMGRTLTRIVTESEGVTVTGAIDRDGVAEIGKDAGVLAGVGELGVRVTTDPLPLFAKADGVLDFTVPAATVGFAEIAAQARIAHIIGTTGLTADDDERIAAAARHAPIVKSGNMSLGVNLLAVLVRQAAQALDPDFDIEVLEMHHRAKVDAPSGTALMLGRAAAAGRGHRAGRAFGARRATAITGAAQARRHRLCDAEGRLGHRRAQRRSSPATARQSNSPTRPPTGRCSRAAPSRRRCGPATESPASTPWPTCWVLG